MKMLATPALSLIMVGTAVAQPNAERTYIDSAFTAVDTNKDGTITRPEFDAFMTARIKKQRAEFDKGFAAADANNDGVIDRNEAKIHDELAKNFDALDFDKNGKLSKEELTTALFAAMKQGSLATGG